MYIYTYILNRGRTCIFRETLGVCPCAAIAIIYLLLAIAFISELTDESQAYYLYVKARKTRAPSVFPADELKAAGLFLRASDFSAINLVIAKIRDQGITRCVNA